MKLTKDSATAIAKQDLSQRLNVPEDKISVVSVTEKDFPDMSLGAPASDEMSAQMISSGWEIKLGTNGEKYDYRADKYQIRLHNFKGSNYVVQS